MAPIWVETGLPRWLSGKRIQCRRFKRCGFHPGLRWSPGVGNGNPFQYCGPGKFHGQKSLAGYSLRGCRVRHHWSCIHTLPFTLKEKWALWGIWGRVFQAEEQQVPEVLKEVCTRLTWGHHGVQLARVEGKGKEGVGTESDVSQWGSEPVDLAKHWGHKPEKVRRSWREVVGCWVDARAKLGHGSLEEQWYHLPEREVCRGTGSDTVSLTRDLFIQVEWVTECSLGAPPWPRSARNWPSLLPASFGLLKAEVPLGIQVTMSCGLWSGTWDTAVG